MRTRFAFTAAASWSDISDPASATVSDWQIIAGTGAEGIKRL